MPRSHSFPVQHVLLFFLLIFALSWKLGAAQVTPAPGETESTDGHHGDGGAFFALRSCHQQLHGDSGEFFSPDYLCSNPSLWCNWTIQVAPGQRIHLQLEDLTPDDACHLKQDEIHVDDPAARSGGHRVLQRCWREARYTSSSSTLEVVLLIGGWPQLPYRGFYGRYQAFGLPAVYHPQEEPHPGPAASSDPGQEVTRADQVESESSAPDVMLDDEDQPSAVMAEPPWEPENPEPEPGENLHLASGNQTPLDSFLATPTVAASTQGTSRSGRGVQLPSGVSDSALDPEQKNHTGVEWNIEEAADDPGEERGATTRSKEEGPATASDKNRTETSTSEGAELQETEQTHLQSNMMELLSEHRGNFNVRNHSEVPHVPGDHLFEAAVEVNFSQDLEEPWENQARSLILSVKALISEQLEALHTPLSMSSKRIKRLNAGVLYILWLRIGQGPGSLQVHRSVHSAMQGLIARPVGLHRKAVIVSVSTADVNECGTQLVLCHVNADCVNHFGSYSCHCRPGFLDQSRLGSGGTVCVDVTAAGSSSGLSAETKGVYVLFFLLSSLVLMLLVAAAALYHRHHRGMFLVRCHSNSSVAAPPEPNNNRHQDGYSVPPESDLPPPPPPARGPREGWPKAKQRRPAVDLPLLRFSPLLPPDGFMEPRDGGKM